MSESGKVAPPIPAPNEMCALFVSAQDERALALVYSLAAQDPDFHADNEAVQQDFAVFDRQLDEVGLWP